MNTGVFSGRADRVAGLWRSRPLGFAVLALVGSLAVGLPRLDLNAHYSAYFDPTDPLRKTHVALTERYAQHDGFLIVLESLLADMLSPDHFAALERLSDALEELPEVQRVSSVADPVFRDDPGERPTRSSLLGHERVGGLLLSEDARLALLEVAADPGPDVDAGDVLELAGRVRAAADAALVGLPIRAHYTGTLALNEAYVRVVRHDLRLFLPGLLVTFAAVLWALFRSPRLAGYVLGHALLATVGAYGLAGWLGLELAALHAFVPVMIVSVSVAGAVHLAASWLRRRERYATPDAAATASVRANLLPLTLASATTALGFLGLATSPSPPVRVLGYLVASGVALSWLMALTVLPGRLRQVADGRLPGFGLGRVADWVVRRRGAVVGAGLAVAALAVMGLRQGEIRDNVFEYFAASSDFRQATSLVGRELGGVNAVLYEIGAGVEYGLFDADGLRATAAFGDWLRDRPEVRRALTVTDLEPLRTRLAAADFSEWLDEAEVRAREAGRPAALAQEVAPDYSASRILVLLEDLDSRDILDFDEAARRWLDEHLGPAEYAGGAGASLLLAAVSDRNARGMFLSLALALVAIAVGLGLLLGSGRIAWVGLVCNLLPVAAIYGLWSAGGGAIGIGAACVMGMILGIVVDDTIYLLTRYARGRRTGAAQPAADALVTVGPALVVTTLVLCTGLALGLLSDFQPIVSIGALSVAIIAAALATDLLLLPALLDRGAVR